MYEYDKIGTFHENTMWNTWDSQNAAMYFEQIPKIWLFTCRKMYGMRLFFTRISCEISQICKILLSLLSKIQVQRKLRLAWCGIYSIFCSKFLVWNTNILQSINDTCTCNIIYVALLSFITKTSWILHVYTWHVHVFI